MNRVQVLEMLIKERGYESGMGAEIGVWNGTTIFHLLRAFPKLKMLGVDEWEPRIGGGTKEYEGYASYANKPIHFNQFKVFNTALEFEKRITLLKINSVHAAEYQKGESFDFIFIDADHRTAFVRADIVCWMPKVKKGGLLLGHDTHFPSVKKAVDDLLPGWKQYDDHVWCVEKGRICLV